jgi:hypothetical protein
LDIPYKRVGETALTHWSFDPSREFKEDRQLDHLHGTDSQLLKNAKGGTADFFHSSKKANFKTGDKNESASASVREGK